MLSQNVEFYIHMIGSVVQKSERHFVSHSVFMITVIGKGCFGSHVDSRSPLRYGSYRGVYSTGLCRLPFL